MTTTFNHLPIELQEMIYKKKHQLEMQDVLDEMKEWGTSRPLPFEEFKGHKNLHLYIIHLLMQNLQDDSLNKQRFLNTISVKNHIVNIKTYTLSQLKEECRKNKLKVSGRKQELIHRLIKLS